MEQLVLTLAERTSRAVARQDADAALMVLTMAAVQAELCEFASINFVDQGRVVTAGATDPVAAVLDDEQYRLGQGPCMQAAVTATTVHSTDVPADPRWPLWCLVAAGRGVAAMVSVALPEQVSGGAGSLNLYNTQQRSTDGSDVVRAAELIAAHAGIALMALNRAGELWKAVDARHRVGQAQGILMERHHIDADEAFQVMRRLSQHRNIPVRTIADHLLDTRQLPI